MTTNNNQPLMDALVSEWQQESPDHDASPMAIVGRIIRLGRLYERDAKIALKPYGLPYTDFDILATLKRSGSPYELTPGELGNAVLLTSGAMTAALDRLETANLISRHADLADKRVKTAKLTRKGERLASKAATARFEVAARAIEALKAGEKTTLTNLLRQLD
ncbi:MAG: MarR family transcriptional regulator [Pseudomonadota bacterium]